MEDTHICLKNEGHYHRARGGFVIKEGFYGLYINAELVGVYTKHIDMERVGCGLWVAKASLFIYDADDDRWICHYVQCDDDVRRVLRISDYLVFKHQDLIPWEIRQTMDRLEAKYERLSLFRPRASISGAQCR